MKSSKTVRRLLLASASERRRKILSELRVHFEIAVPEIKEVFYSDNPRRTATENAFHKNQWAGKQYPDHHIITADTIVAFEEKCVTKPSSFTEALDFLKMFSGKPQTIYTAVGFCTPHAHASPKMEVVESTVLFKPLTDSLIKEYFSLVNPMDKAGGYDIDHHGEMIIASFAGSYTNIMGLPQEIVARWLKKEGFL